MTDAAEFALDDIWACASTEEALQRTTNLARRALKAPLSVLSSFTPEEHILRSTSGVDPLGPSLAGMESACRRVADSGLPLIVSNASTDLSNGTGPHGLMSYLGVPLQLSSGSIGTLSAMDFQPRDWSEDDVVLATELAASLAFQIELQYEITLLKRTEASRLAADHSLDVDELRAPLQAVVGFSDLLRGETQPDRVPAHALNIQAAVESVVAIVNQSPVRAEVSPIDGEDGTVTRADASGTPTRVLLADDLDLNRKLIADMLGTDGHLVDCVADGAEAVKAAAERRYDVILMDMIMPGMDGITATREIRKLPAPACDVPILALTAHSFKDQLESCLTAGMNATLTKPMSLEALTSAVSNWTRKREAA